MRFSGKIAAVTGAARGIGFAIAKRLYDEGCEYVAMIDVNADEIAQAGARAGSVRRAGGRIRRGRGRSRKRPGGVF